MPFKYPIIEELFMAPDAPWCFESFTPRPFNFWLDSGMDHQKLGRWSFMGSDPFLVMRSRSDEITLIKDGIEEKQHGNPFDVLGELLQKYKLDSNESGIPFTGGVVGYLGYDLGRFIEKLPSKAVDDLNLPETYLCFYDALVAFDHVAHRVFLISTGFPETDEKKRRHRAYTRLNELRQLVMFAPPPVDIKSVSLSKKLTLKSNFSHEGYLKAVATAREYICSGDIFEVNLSQCIEMEMDTPPFELYKRLRRINPAPFASYFNFDSVSIVGSSPERFMKKKGGWVETRPIKGTKPRGKTPEQDKALGESLLASKKDRAENIMIVDLERNDIGRVCRFGTVQVTELAILETWPTVFHLTSTVVGQLHEGKSIIDLLKATFPGGSITGAPKVRAMEIIDELEPTRRGIYCGSLGYIGFNGDMDLNIVIRTIVIKDDRAYFQVGGAIVYDSEPESEYIETLDKGKALIMALTQSSGDNVEIIS
jgi:para-aminobenzoate synthetase component I